MPARAYCQRQIRLALVSIEFHGRYLDTREWALKKSRVWPALTRPTPRAEAKKRARRRGSA